MKLIRNILFLTEDSKKYFIPIVLFVLGMEVFRIVQTDIFAQMITRISNNLVFSLMLLLWWAFYYALYWLSDAGADKYTIIKLASDVERNIPVRVLKHLFTLPLKFFTDIGTETIAERVIKGTDGTKWILMTVSWSLISTAAQALLGFGYLARILWQWGIILFASVVSFAWLTVSLNRIKSPKRKRRYDLYEAKKHLLQQLMHNIPVIKAFVQEDPELVVCEQLCDELRDVSVTEMGYEIKFNLLRGVCMIIGLGGMIVVGDIACKQGLIEVGTVVGAMNISVACLLSLYRLGWVFVEISDHYEGVSRLVDILRENPEIPETNESLIVEDLGADVVFDNVHYAYPNGDDKPSEDCLAGLNFSIKAGQTVALVGPSGCGKTTLINLILRFMNPTKGAIYIGGHDITLLELLSYRKGLSVVFQRGELFSGRTIAQNVAEGLDEKDISKIEDVIWGALTKANAHEFVKNLSGGKGIHTVVRERASNLSGGQQQRISVAAALARDPKILLLDEATSSLDTKSERAIQQALKDLQEEGKTTVFVIAHRLSTVRNADMILVLDEGRLVQQGTHAELVQTEGLYSDMVGSQTV